MDCDGKLYKKGQNVKFGFGLCIYYSASAVIVIIFMLVVDVVVVVFVIACSEWFLGKVRNLTFS